MYKSMKLIIWSCMVVMLVLSAGCRSSKSIQLDEYFRQIEVGRSNATDVLNMLPEEGMLHTTSSVSILNKKGWSREVGIVTFNQADSLVQRKIYLRRHSDLLLERIYLFIQTVVPAEVLEEPYENDMRKHVAILRHCHETMIEDVKPFAEDQETVSQMGLARTGLGLGILKLADQPRDADQLLQSGGFKFKHSTLGRCQLNLGQIGENVFTVELRSRAVVDIFTGW